MITPPLPTEEQIAQALLPLSQKLSKRNVRLAQQLIQGASLRSVAARYQLSVERVFNICTEVISTLRRRLFSEAERQGEFASYAATKLTDLRHPARQAWWVAVLEQVAAQAPSQSELFLDRRPSGITLFTRAVETK